VALARAIIDPPGLLLADEPTSSLDVSLRAVILNLLNRLRRELGLAMLFVTHDLAAARVIADRIVVMREGEIVEIGEADRICTNPQDDYTQRLLLSLPGEDLPQHGDDHWRLQTS
jgi:peptide/nickel transport system ATP-binding protein